MRGGPSVLRERQAVGRSPLLWERLARRRREKNGAFPRDGMGEGSRLFTTGWELDGKVRSHLVHGVGRDYIISRGWDETGRETIPGREYVGNSVGHISWERSGTWSGIIVLDGRETPSGMVGYTIGNTGCRQRLIRGICNLVLFL